MKPFSPSKKLFRSLSAIAAVSAALFTGANLASAQTVRDVKVVTASASTGLYTPNRAPLQPAALLRLPIGSIKPEGWLREQLVLDANGLPGRMSEVSDYVKFEGNGWVDPKSDSGWEELPYWLRGYGDLGYVLKDPKILAQSQKWIDGILTSQRPDGWFGPDRLRTSLEKGPDMWPHMLILYALQSYEEYSRDPRVIPFMTKFFQFQAKLPGAVFGRSWAGWRWADDLQAVYWLYNRTGDAFLLDLAKKIHDNSANYVDNIPTWHNVNIAQGIREPAEYFTQSGDRKFLTATEQDYDTVMGLVGQFAGGGFAGDENVRKGYGDPRQGFETCGMVEYMNTFEIMSRISGDPIWADRCEDVAFNSLPAALTADHKDIHYITSANSVEIDDIGKQHNQFQNGTFPMQAFKPGIHDYRCCPANYPMGWPYYAENLWLATADNGLCASLYAASEMSVKAGKAATPVSIREATDYPFKDVVDLTVTTAKPTKFPLYLRIPGWCDGATVTVNGAPLKVDAARDSFVVVEREWKTGDHVALRLPMHIAVRDWKNNKNSVSVDYGPLTYSLAIGEKWERDGGTDAWPEYAVHASTSWNYGLVLDAAKPSRSFEVVRKGGATPAQPFTPESAPILLKAKARKIAAWTADADNVVNPLQPSPVRSSAATETVTLIPMGAARLRITSFPTIGQGPQAHDWEAPHAAASTARASFVHDELTALDDGLEPVKSADNSKPRFTWWDHKGTEEWVEYDFPKAQTILATSVYWFDDTGFGQCRTPQSWTVLYKDGDSWKPVEASSPFDVDTDRYNRTMFKPVSTTALRVVARLKAGYSGGILRWKIEPAAR